MRCILCIFAVISFSKVWPNSINSTKRQTKYVSAKAQATPDFPHVEEEILTEKEEEIYKRGRNTNSHTKAKNADVVTYRMSTGFEAVMGYLIWLKMWNA